MTASPAGELLGRLDPMFLTLCRRLGNLAADARMPFYIVGGIVRDLMLGYSSMDFDFVLEGDAITFSDRVEKRFGGTIHRYPRFRTATWRPKDMPSLDVDFVTARSESYAHPAALPSITPADLRADLQRRDFAINTMAVRLDPPRWGELVDPFGGQVDLENQRLRVLYPESFIDDPTRIWRGVRFAHRLAFSFSPETAVLLDSGIQYMAALSGERLLHELLLLAAERDPASPLRHLEKLGVLAAVHPGWRWVEDVVDWWAALDRQLGSPLLNQTAPEWDRPVWRVLLFLVAQPGQVGIELGERLRLTVPQHRALVAGVRLRDNLQEDPFAGAEPAPSTVDEWLRPLADPLAGVVLAALTRPAGKNDRWAKWLKKYVLDWSKIKPVANGDTLRAMGLVPGPVYGEVLGALRAAWLDGRVSSAAEEAVFLERLLDL